MPAVMLSRVAALLPAGALLFARVTFAGLLLNFIAIAANGGVMPADPEIAAKPSARACRRASSRGSITTIWPGSTPWASSCLAALRPLVPNPTMTT